MNKELSKRAGENLSNYIGQGIELVNFAGNGSARQYTMKLANNHATATRKIALVPGFSASKAEFEALTGRTIDGLVTETIADVVKSGSPKPLEAARAYFLRNPANVTQINMLVSDPLQFENAIEVFEGLNPFGDPATRTIVPSSHKTPDQSNDKLVHIKGEKLQFNDQTGAILEINPQTTVTLVFFVDAIFNAAKVLDDSVMRTQAAREYQRQA